MRAMSLKNTTIEDRLVRLESSARRWKLTACFLGVGVVVGVLSGQSPRSSSANTLLRKLHAQPQVVGLVSIQAQGTTYGLVRVWSDGETEALATGNGYNLATLFSTNGVPNPQTGDELVPFGFDPVTNQWWPNGDIYDELEIGESKYSRWIYWNSFVDEDLTPPSP